MATQTFIIPILGRKVVVTLDPPADCPKIYNDVPESITGLIEIAIEDRDRRGTFTDMPDEERESGAGGCLLSGFWRVIEIDYQQICRVLSWEYNFGQDESLSEELFNQYYGTVMGSHYYDKWTNTYHRKLYGMLVYFGNNPHDGQLFCDMIACQMLRYEQRTKKQDHE